MTINSPSNPGPGDTQRLATPKLAKLLGRPHHHRSG